MFSNFPGSRLIPVFSLAAAVSAHALELEGIPLDFTSRLAADPGFAGLVADEEGEGPPGGYLLRWRHDWNGDGVDDFFYATSLQADLRGADWTVYLSGSGETYQQARNTIFIHPEVIYQSSAPTAGEVATFVRSGLQHGNVLRYHLGPDGQILRSDEAASEDQLHAFDTSGTPDSAAVFALGSAVPAHPEKILLAEFLQNPHATWSAYSSDFSLTRQDLDPADSTAINLFSAEPVPALLKKLASTQVPPSGNPAHANPADRESAGASAGGKAAGNQVDNALEPASRSTKDIPPGKPIPWLVTILASGGVMAALFHAKRRGR